VDDVPVIFEKRWLDAELCESLTEEMAAGSLYDAMINQLSLAVTGAEQQVRAVTPDAHERALLQIRQGQACLRVEGKGFLADGRTVWMENTLFRGDRYEIHGILSPQGGPFGRLIDK
jgi:DNA-binding GntR family transcriptional regulator